MYTKVSKTLFVVVLLLVLQAVAPVLSHAIEKDSASFRILFPVDSAKIQPEFFDNKAQLDSISNLWSILSHSDKHYNVTIHIRGNASIEGPEELSMSLARSRGFVTLYHLYKQYSIPDSLMILYESRHMLEGANERIDTLSAEVKAQVDFETVRHLMNTTKPSALRRTLIKYDTTKVAWHWFMDNVLSPTRYCDVFICYDYEPVVIAEPVVQDTLSVNDADTVKAVANTMFRVKNNLIYDVAAVANLGFEVGFAKRYSFSILGTFSPWNYGRNDFKIRTLLFQPEFRFYLKEGFNGHYFGLDGHFGWYNIAIANRPTRYQDRNGNSPLWGAGLVYGYVLPLNDHWGFDFSIGGGYAHLDYDCFYNVDDGARYTSDVTNYWGLTNLGISFFYRF